MRPTLEAFLIHVERQENAEKAETGKSDLGRVLRIPRHLSRACKPTGPDRFNADCPRLGRCLPGQFPATGALSGVCQAHGSFGGAQSAQSAQLGPQPWLLCL